MKYLTYIKLIFSLIFLPFFLQGQGITDYKLFTGYGTSLKDGQEYIILRKFLKDRDTCYLAVSPSTLNTAVITYGSIKAIAASWPELRSRFASTPYIKVLIIADQNSTLLQDAGIKKLLPGQKGIDLTIDLCPSHRPLDRIVFTNLMTEMGKIEKPVPLAISITGVWTEKHLKDFKWLDSLDRAGDLSILWINHSYNHHTYRNIPLKSNFLLAPGTDLSAEVLNTEILLMKYNIVPSVFFRFPGLVSDRQIFDRILAFGLIPVGSDAWLAKGQWPAGGSIVLIHGNGNEPVGVRDFLELLKKEQPEVDSGQWELFDLRESLVKEYK